MKDAFEKFSKLSEPARILIGGLIAFAILGVAFFATNEFKGWGFDSKPSNAELRTYCEIDVKEKLKAPSTADFSYPSIWERGENTWMVKGTVEAENSFGGRVSHDYECEIYVDGDDIRTSINFY